MNGSRIFSTFLMLATFSLVAACSKETPVTRRASSPVAASASTTLEKPNAAASSFAKKPRSIKQEATRIAQAHLLIDGHVDLPFRLYRSRNKAGKLTENVAERTRKGDFDFVRAKAGGFDAPFMSIYIPAKYQITGGAKKLADTLIDMVESIAEKNPEKFSVAKSPDEVERTFRQGKIALPMGIENGAALEGKVENLQHFFKRGVRYITLTHSKDNSICDSSYATTRTHKGLSPFGVSVVKEMNRIGIMVDVSHISDQAFQGVIKTAVVPMIASHSSCRHFTPKWERNMSDSMIKQLADHGGVIMINYGSSFLDDKARKERSAMHTKASAYRAKHKHERNSKAMKAWHKRYNKSQPPPFATVQKVADHIDHVVRLSSIDHVGLGSDFDGVGDSLPTGLKDASQMPNLIAELLRRGYSEKQIVKIMSGNVLRVWRAVEAHARMHSEPRNAR